MSVKDVNDDSHFTLRANSHISTVSALVTWTISTFFVDTIKR